MRSSHPLIGILALGLYSAALAQPFTYQGLLKDGGTLADGAYDMQFLLFNVGTGTPPGSQVGPTITQHGVNVVNGLFTVELDFGTDAFSGQDRWLAIDINGVHQNPRQKVTAAPMATIATKPWVISGDNISYTDGNVGVGTASPIAPLDVRGIDSPAGSPSLVVGAHDGAQGRRAITSFWSTFTNTPGDNLARRSADIVSGYQLGNWGKEYLSFNVGNNGDANLGTLTSEKMRITSGGNVGIGTVTPSYPLTIASPFGPKIGFTPGTPTGKHFGIGLQSQLLQIYSDTPASDIAFGTGSSGNFNETVRFTGSGEVGIGTSNPTRSLDIRQGDMILTGADGQGRTIIGNNASTDAGFIQTYNSLHSLIFGVGDNGNGQGSHLFLNDGAGNNLIFFGEGGAGYFKGLGINTYDLHGRDLYVNGPAAITGSNTLEFGADVPGKEASAGKIAYQLYSSGLDIVGAGSAVGSRKVQVWAEGGTSFTGDISANGIHYVSDARYKQNIVTVDNALRTIMSLRGVSFEWDLSQWKSRGFGKGKQLGFIAQEVEKVLPELVKTDSDGYKSVAYANVVPVLVEAVKEEQAQVQALSQANDQMQKQVDALAAKNAELVSRLDQIERALGTGK